MISSTPIFQKIPDSLEGRWELILKLIKRWHGVTISWEEHQYDQKIEALQTSAGFPFSQGIKYWIRFLESMIEHDNWIFRDCYDISFRKELDALTLLIQGEADYYWGVKTENLNIPDPPVEGYFLDYDSDEGKFIWDKTISESLTGFVIKYILDYNTLLKGNGFRVRIEDIENEITIIQNCFEHSLKFEDYWIMESNDVIASVSKIYGSYDLKIQFLNNSIFESEIAKPIVEMYFPKSYSRNFNI